MKALNSAQVVIISVKAFRRLTLGTRDLRLFKSWRNSSYNAGGYLILQIEDVFESAVETIRPQMRTFAASINCPVMRTRFAALRTLPSST